MDSGSPERTLPLPRWVWGTGSGPWAQLYPCSAVPKRGCLSEWGSGVHTCPGWCPPALWSLVDPEVESVSMRALQSAGAKVRRGPWSPCLAADRASAPLGATSTPHPPPFSSLSPHCTLVGGWSSLLQTSVTPDKSFLLMPCAHCGLGGCRLCWCHGRGQSVLQRVFQIPFIAVA